MAGLEGTKTDRQALTGNIAVKHGVDGKDAYQYAVEGGYKSDEEKFGRDLVNAIGTIKEVDILSDGIYKIVYNKTLAKSVKIYKGTVFEVGDLIEISKKGESWLTYTIHSEKSIVKTVRGIGNPAKELITVKEDFSAITFEAGYTIIIKRNLVKINAENISKLSKDIEYLKNESGFVTIEDVKNLFVPITQEEYDALEASGTVDMDKYYYIKKEEVK